MKQILLFVLSSLTFQFTVFAQSPSTTIAEASGPSEKIGHSLQGADSRKRIDELVEREKAELEAGTTNGSHAHDVPALVGVPSALVSLGNVLPAYGIIVEKLHHRLSLVEKSVDGIYRIVKSYRAITGKKIGNKESRGDLKTPEGVYFVTGRIDGKKLPSKYGALALTLDYPNIFDQQVRKTGSGIWIHATDRPQRLLTAFDTEGCVALSNKDILELATFVKDFETPVVITQEMTTVQSEDTFAKSKERSLAMLEAWRQSWEASNFELYSSYYSDDFKSQGKNKKNWLAFKQQLGIQRANNISVTLDDPKIVAVEDQLLVVFLQSYKSDEKTDYGRKFLYLKWEGDRYRIVSEKWYPL